MYFDYIQCKILVVHGLKWRILEVNEMDMYLMGLEKLPKIVNYRQAGYFVAAQNFSSLKQRCQPQRNILTNILK